MLAVDSIADRIQAPARSAVESDDADRFIAGGVLLERDGNDTREAALRNDNGVIQAGLIRYERVQLLLQLVGIAREFPRVGGANRIAGTLPFTSFILIFTKSDTNAFSSFRRPRAS